MKQSLYKSRNSNEDTHHSKQELNLHIRIGKNNPGSGLDANNAYNENRIAEDKHSNKVKSEPDEYSNGESTKIVEHSTILHI